jgi:hypothetical protein
VNLHVGERRHPLRAGRAARLKPSPKEHLERRPEDERADLGGREGRRDGPFHPPTRHADGERHAQRRSVAIDALRLGTGDTLRQEHLRRATVIAPTSIDRA